MSTITDEDKKKYRKLENTLQSINQQFISLSPLDERKNNEILTKLLETLTSEMKSNSLFKELYTRTFFGGSYYDGLRVGEPNEFDLDLLMSLPKALLPNVIVSNKPGYVHVQVDLDAFKKQKDLALRYSGIEKLIGDKGYLDNDKVRRWMGSVVTKALNTFPAENAEHIIKLPSGTFYAKKRESGPALTLNLREKGTIKIIDIDLVPCFEFTEWPKNGFKSNPVKKPNCFIVPKPLKTNETVKERYWRLSFQEQERELIDSKQYLKPSIKLLKKLRDTQNHVCVASYYLKTIALWQTDKMSAEDWRSSLGSVFMKLLRDYHEAMKNKKIPYFWNQKNNLIESVSEKTASDIENRLKIIINKIDNNLEDPNIIAEYLTPKLGRHKHGTPPASDMCISDDELEDFKKSTQTLPKVAEEANEIKKEPEIKIYLQNIWVYIEKINETELVSPSERVTWKKP